MKHEENNLYKECLKDLGNECIEGSKLEYYLEKIKNNEGLDFQGNQYMCNTLIATCLRQHFYDEAVKQKHLEIWVIETGTELNETESKAKVEALEQWIKKYQWIGEYDYSEPKQKNDEEKKVYPHQTHGALCFTKVYGNHPWSNRKDGYTRKERH